MSWLSGKQKELYIPDADYEFVGDFKPPLMGQKHIPVQVQGSGVVGVSSDGLVVDGYESKDRSCLVVLGFFVVFAMGIVAVGVSGVDADWAEVIVGTGMVLFLGYVAKSRTSNEDAKKKPISILFPWDTVRRIEVPSDEARSDRVTMLIKGHKPRGLVHFVPQKAPRKIADALRRAQEKYASDVKRETI